jgi:CBS domain-containing protein
MSTCNEFLGSPEQLPFLIKALGENMPRISDVMTNELATVPPDATVAQIAEIMRDRDIGDVLIVENGKLRGIITDRDLALQVLAEDHDPQSATVDNFMNKDVVTGDASWNLDRAAKTMAKYQIRRLPIVEAGRLVGIVSLGDIARYEKSKSVVSKSLEAVSEPDAITVSGSSGRNGTVLGIALAVLVASLVIWLRYTESGQAMASQVTQSPSYQNAKRVVTDTVDKAVEAASDPKVRDIGNQVMSFMK